MKISKRKGDASESFVEPGHLLIGVVALFFLALFLMMAFKLGVPAAEKGGELFQCREQLSLSACLKLIHW